MKLIPPLSPGLRVSWSNTIGPVGRLTSNVYRAPLVIPADTPPAHVMVVITGPGIRMSVSTEIQLEPSSVPGSDECLGPGQVFSTTAPTIVPEFQELDVLPQLVRQVPPDYPQSDLARAVEDTVVVRALLCRTGHVLDAYVPPSYRDLDSPPIRHDPKLVAAAIAAVRQYVFTPGMKSGQAVATWVDNSVMFRR